MSLTAKDSGGSSFPPVPQGQHYAITTAIYDLGTQVSERFGNVSRKVLIQWELPEQRIDIEKDGEKQNLPRAISKQYTLSLHEKANLRHDLESWRGKTFTEKECEGFDVLVLLGVPCMLQILHKNKDGKTYSNISTITPVAKGTPKKQPENPLRTFSFEDGSNIPEGTPEWIQKIIEQSEEWQMKDYYPDSDSGVEQPQYSDDDIPF